MHWLYVGCEGGCRKQCPLCQNVMPGVCASNQPRRTRHPWGIFTYWHRNGYRGGEQQGQRVFLSELQTVCINSTWASIIQKQCSILYSLKRSQKCVGVLKYVCVGVPECDCYCVRVPLMWPSAWGFTPLSRVHSLTVIVCPAFIKVHSHCAHTFCLSVDLKLEVHFWPRLMAQ